MIDQSPIMAPHPVGWSDIFDLWPSDRRGKSGRSPGRLAKDLHVNPSTADMWVQRGRIPVNYWWALIPLLESRFGIVITPRELFDLPSDVRAEDSRAKRKAPGQEAA